MKQWTEFPWIDLTTMSLSLVCLILGLSMLLSKYPAGRWLGLLILSYMGILLGSFFELPVVSTLMAAISATVTWLYIQAFFYQKRRFAPWHFLVIALMIIATLLIPAQWVIYLHAICSTAYIVVSFRSMNHEANVRGFSYFRNSGSRIVWIRNFMAVGALLIIIPFFIQNELIIGGILLSLLLLVTYQLVSESAFFAPIPIANKYQKSTLTPAIKASIIEKINEVMDEDKYFLRDDISLSGLAETLGASTHHVSQVLNESLKMSFQDLVARYRIREACKLLRNADHEGVKIENIANSIGYNSKSAFNTAFKKRVGMTPSEYRSAKNVLTYGEERLSEEKEPSYSRKFFALNHVFKLKINADMIYQFLKIFTRNVKRNGFFSFLNVFGLVVGLTCAMLIYLYIADEKSYDQHIPDYERVYRIAWINDNPQTRTPHPMAQAMVADLPEVEAAVSFSPWYGPGLTKGEVRVKNVKQNISFEESDFFFADSTLLDVFGFEVLEGDRDALSKPFSFVISESLATKYFGDSSAIGQELLINDMPLAVSAVIADMPPNTHFHMQGIIPYVTLKQINPTDTWMTWADFGHFNYIKLKDGVEKTALEAKIPDWVSSYLDWDHEAITSLKNGEMEFQLQPISSIHLDSHLRWELEENGSQLYIHVLTATLFFLLLIAAINYVNLTTAKSIERAKEVGVRKTLGALSDRLAIQFYVESVLFCLIAMVISFGIVALLIPSFNQLVSKQVDITRILEWPFIWKAVAMSIGIGLLAGVYPAMALSAFKPTEVLKGKLSTSATGVRIRGALLVLQFTISAILIAGSFIIMRQIDYMRTTSLGFDQDAVISLSVPISVEYGGVNLPPLRSAQKQMQALSGVKSTTLVSGLPGGQFNQHQYSLADRPADLVDASELMVDFSFEEVFGIQIKEGRSFDRSYAKDSLDHVLVNESLVESLQLANPIGSKLVNDNNGNPFEVTIIGVVEDFHFKSLHQAIQPLIMVCQPLGAGHLVVKLDGESFSGTIQQLEPIYAQLQKDLPFEYHFLDQQLAKLYDQEEKTLRIFSIFAFIALILAALGLVGMSIALLNQRIKEIGIRKILGASPIQIMQMVLGQFLRLVVIALMIGLPVAFILMKEWVQEFYYQAPFGWAPYILSMIVLMAVASISVIFAVSKITFSNPANALRYE